MDKQYSIREVSAKFNLPASTLRYYEEVGILTDIPRNSSGKRIYLEKHINRLKTICCFKNTGMSIAQLQEFFQYEQQEPSHIDDILKLKSIGVKDSKKLSTKEIFSLYEKIEELIRSHVYLGKQSATGFELVKCQICNDYKERGGFKFSENEIGYNCFNCGTSAKFEDDNTHKISHGFTNVLLSFGISKTELKSINHTFFIFE